MADCNACHEKRRELDPVPYLAHEKSEARHERIVSRLIIAMSFLATLLVVCVFMCVSMNSNCIEKIEKINKQWIEYLAEYDYMGYSEERSYTQDGNGVNIIGDNNGVDYNGTKPTSDANDANS